MPFDRTNQTHLTALKNEVTQDPLAMGYAAISNVNKLVDLLNSGPGNKGGETIGAPFTPRVIAELMLKYPTRFNPSGQFTQGHLEAVKALLEIAAFTEDDLNWARPGFRALFPSNYTDLLSDLDARTRPLSRAEVLFGAGTQLTVTDWIVARDNG